MKFSEFYLCFYNSREIWRLFPRAFKFPSVYKAPLKFGYKIETSALYVYCSCSLKVQEKAQSTRSQLAF